MVVVLNWAISQQEFWASSGRITKSLALCQASSSN